MTTRPGRVNLRPAVPIRACEDGRVSLSHAIGRFNRVATNRLTSPVAGRLPGFGIITHRGRRSGRTYRTPVNVFRRPGGFVVALTYGRGDWVRTCWPLGKRRFTREDGHITSAIPACSAIRHAPGCRRRWAAYFA